MKNYSKTGTPAQGAQVPPMSPEDFKKLIEKDLDMLAALVNMLRTEERMRIAIAEIIFEKSENLKTTQEAAKSVTV